MKKKSLRSLSLKKSNVANISGGLADGQAQDAASALACPNPTIVLTVHSILPWDCKTVSCYSKCEWCDAL